MSSSDNSPHYPVKLRGISADLTDLGSQVGEQDLGTLSAAKVSELLTKIAAIEPVRLIDADPQILIAGVRGKFSAKPNRGTILLRPLGESNATYIELHPASVTDWLDQPDGTPLSADDASSPNETTSPKTSSARRGLVTALLAFSLTVLGFSTYYTLRPQAVIPENAFSVITDQTELSRLQQQTVGKFVNEDGNSTVIVRGNGQLDYVESDSDGTSLDEASDRYVIMNMTDTGPVLRASDLGALVIHDANTLIMNGEGFHRK